MSAILSITFPIYAAIGIGFLVVKKGWFAQADMRVLGRYVLNIALPALLFNAVATRDFAEVFHPAYMLVFLASGLGTMAVAFGWFTLIGIDKRRRALAVMGCSCPNSAYVGYPVLLLTLPDLAGVILALNTLVEIMVVVPMCLFLMDLARDEAGGSLPLKLLRIFWGVTRRPLVIGLLLGLAVSVMGIPVPGAGTRLLSMLAASASALSLVAIGGSLAALPVGGNRLLAGQIAAGKLLVHPAMAALAVAALPMLGFAALPPEMALAVILSAAMPMFTIYVVFAQEQGLEGVASLAMLAATTGGFVTLSLLLAWLI
jgi:predicted permease